MKLTNFEELVLKFRWIAIGELVGLHYLFVPIARHPVIAVEGGLPSLFGGSFENHCLQSDARLKHAMKKVVPSHIIYSLNDILFFEGKDLFNVGTRVSLIYDKGEVIKNRASSS